VEPITWTGRPIARGSRPKSFIAPIRGLGGRAGSAKSGRRNSSV
jgi:hypothetical protein